MSEPPHSDTVTNRWGWQFMQGDGLSVAAMNSVGAKRIPSAPSAPRCRSSRSPAKGCRLRRPASRRWSITIAKTR